VPRTRGVIGLASCLLLGLAAGPAVAEPVRLVTPIVYGTHLPGLGEPVAQLAKLVKQLSADTLELDLKQPGDGTQPQEILDKVSRGTVDAGFATANFWAGKIPAAALFGGFPFGPDAKGYVDWFFAGNGRKLYQDMYGQAGLHVHVIPCGFGGGEAAGWFAKEIHAPGDLKGLRMRIFGLGGRVMAKLGATTVLLPGGALAEAFDKHQIDAAEFLTPVVDARQNLQDHVKLIYLPGWHQPETVLELLINEDRWNALGEQQQAVLETACRATLLETLAQSSRLQADALAELAAKHGVRIETLPEAVRGALHDAWDKVAQEEGNRDTFFKAVLDDLDGFRAAKPNPAVPPMPPMPPATSAPSASSSTP
jgi:TRAP-type mannitol/chloroaromatic compound transport system substrate-binding protein